MKKYRDATIRVVPNGFIIKIGCQEVVAETTDKLLKMIKNYLDNPEKTEKEVLDKSMMFRQEDRATTTSVTTSSCAGSLSSWAGSLT